MEINDTIFRTLMKQGYSIEDGKKIWNIADTKLWYLTPELSQGFLNLHKYVPYRIKVFDTEIALIEKNAGKFQDLCCDENFNLVDLGCGDGSKAIAFIKTLSKNAKIRYCPVDISQYFLDKASEAVKKENFSQVVEIKPILTDFKEIENHIGLLRNEEFRKNVVLLLGETISTYDINDLLFHISESLWKDDLMIIGNGYKVGDRFVELDKYKDPLFNDWFIHIMKCLGFQENEINQDVRFQNGRLEFFYKLKSDKEISHNGKKVIFKKGDEIIVAVQYKYYEQEWQEFFDLYFSKVELLKNTEREYFLAVCKK